jgi:K+-transporting ATPase ATPase C chain
MWTQLRVSIVMLLVMSAVTGIAYPLAITGIAQIVFPRQANGSLIVRDGQPIGSELIGQPFDDPQYFWGRPSATSPAPYEASASRSSNLGPTNPALASAVRDRVAALRVADPSLTGPIPVDLVTTSASGLDPDVSLAAALFQVNRVAKARGLAPVDVRGLVMAHAQGRTLGFLGEPRVNVLLLNLALDHTSGQSAGGRRTSPLS